MPQVRGVVRITADEIDELCDAVDSSLSEVEKELGLTTTAGDVA